MIVLTHILFCIKHTATTEVPIKISTKAETKQKNPNETLEKPDRSLIFYILFLLWPFSMMMRFKLLGGRWR